MTTVASSPAAFVSPFEFRHVLRRHIDEGGEAIHRSLGENGVRRYVECGRWRGVVRYRCLAEVGEKPTGDHRRRECPVTFGHEHLDPGPHDNDARGEAGGDVEGKESPVLDGTY